MSDASTSAAPTPVVMFKKGPKSRPKTTSRRRSVSPQAEATPDDSSDTAVVRPTKKSIANPLVQGSKRRRLPGDDTPGGLVEFEAEGGGIRGDDFAVRSTNWDLDENVVEETATKRVKLNENGDIDDGMYHGQSGYLKTLTRRDGTTSDAKMKTGPIRATANIRTITMMDYQPDICTPFKTTGYCGYGDSCKFLHDRSDYLAGWQLDQLDPNDGAVQEVEEEEEMLPFACLICKKEFTEPVVTKCGHYFCMKCAVNRFIKSPKCYACGAATNGIFSKAEKLLAKLEAKRQRRMEEKGIVEEESDGGIEIGGGSDDEERESGSDDESRGSEIEE